MKEKYENPSVSIITLSRMDAVSTSYGGGGGDDIVTPDDEFY